MYRNSNVLGYKAHTLKPCNQPTQCATRASSAHLFLPISRNDMNARGWNELDIILITGDAYVDHHSFGAAVIGRVLEREGFRVGIIAQPDWNSTNDFTRCGKPRLFFGITSGNVDSMIANYTATKSRRKADDYSPGGIPNRPDRAVIVYANRVREVFGDVPIVLGGIEASMRRFAHYDYWDNSVRRSILVDARADVLAYGMAEEQICEIAHRLNDGASVDMLDNIRGTVVTRKQIDDCDVFVEIPSFEEVKKNPDAFNDAFKKISGEQSPLIAKPVAQKHGDRYVIQFPPPFPLAQKKLDAIYELPYQRAWHPSYDKQNGIHGFETVRFSMVSHRGCPGACSFCSLSLHQGRIVQSRSCESLLREATLLTHQKSFKGSITDMGGPTANVYHAMCPQWKKGNVCTHKNCLVPTKCTSLSLGYDVCRDVYKKIRSIHGVKHLFISSGIRYDLLVDDTPSTRAYLETLCAHHISGQLKVAPEHAAASVLTLMNKPQFSVYETFAHCFAEANKKVNKQQFLVHYFICGHPGTTLRDALHCAVVLAKKKIYPEQIQDFIPLPMTAAGCMYYTRKNPFTGEAVHVPDEKERRMQRALIHYKHEKHRHDVIKVLTQLRAIHLCPLFGITMSLSLRFHRSQEILGN